MTVWSPVEQDPFHPREVDQPNVALPADRSDRIPLVVTQVVSRRHTRVRHEDRSGPIADGGRQGVRIEPPFVAFDAQRHHAWHRAHDPHAIDHPRVGRIGQDDLVARIGHGEQGIHHGVAFAARHDDLRLGIEPHARAIGHLCGHRTAKLDLAGERQPAVGIVFSHRLSGRLQRGLGRTEVGVEILQVEDVGVIAHRQGHPIDSESGNAGHPSGAHRFSD